MLIVNVNRLVRFITRLISVPGAFNNAVQYIFGSRLWKLGCTIERVIVRSQHLKLEGSASLDVIELRKRGFVRIPSIGEFKSIRGVLRNNYWYARGGSVDIRYTLAELEGSRMTGSALLGQSGLEELLQLLAWDKIFNLGANALGNEAAALEDVSCMWLSGGCQPENIGTDMWHRDRDGWSVIKLMTYLSPCSENDPVHQYVDGSHLDHFGWVKEKRFGKEKVEGRAISSITGNVGDSFIIKPEGLHRSKPFGESDRLLLQLIISVSPTGLQSGKFSRESFGSVSSDTTAYFLRRILKN